MHDLRRQALESGKTVSRKARSRQTSLPSSKTNSRSNSRTGSRAGSRQGSDDEEGNLSDETSYSVNSIDDVLASEDVANTTDAWREALQTRIDQIIERKRSSVAGREESLSAYTRFATASYIQEIIHGRTDELVAAFLKSIKAESSERETTLALKALVLTVITEPSDSIYELIYRQLQRTISDSESNHVKAAAIHALGTSAFYGGASDDEIQSVMDQYIEIIESDGNSVGAGDDGEVVTAALEDWGFLATQLEDIEEASEAAMEAFVEQLESSEPSVQIAAGENIALVFEKSFTEREDDEEVESSEEDSDDPEASAPADAPKMVKRYDPYRRVDQLKHQLSELASVSSRRLSKKDRKTLHTNFADILNSVENPTRGPRDMAVE
ncbi:MAG: hypothetical protein M4579_005124 [Chaenotheca gracillima]|nr:MAG: hypothetical protein M4579_005124 [Chaenotheca gracillima]